MRFSSVVTLALFTSVLPKCQTFVAVAELL